jgi:hypothetical protein
VSNKKRGKPAFDPLTYNKIKHFKKKTKKKNITGRTRIRKETESVRVQKVLEC